MRLDEACGGLMRPSQVRLKRSFLNAEGEEHLLPGKEVQNAIPFKAIKELSKPSLCSAMLTTC